MFGGYLVLESHDIKRHRPIMLTLRVKTLQQQIDVQDAPVPFPVETMRRMKPADERKLAQDVLAPRRDDIEECHTAQPPSTQQLAVVLTDVAENYLERRTMGASGPAGKKGRGGALRRKKEALHAGDATCSGGKDSGGEADPEVLHLKKQLSLIHI